MPNSEARNLNEYLNQVPRGRVEGTRRIVEIMRDELPGADERVQSGIVILARGGRDVIGIAAREGFYSLHVPHPGVVEEFAERLGPTDPGKDCLRFNLLDDIDFSQLRRLVRACAAAAEAEGE